MAPARAGPVTLTSHVFGDHELSDSRNGLVQGRAPVTELARTPSDLPGEHLRIVRLCGGRGSDVAS